MLPFAYDPPQVTIDILSMPALLEAAHDNEKFHEMFQGHTNTI